MATTEIKTLQKITYENLQQFVEDINRNFAVIENSPLYKGIPGDAGERGTTGLTGERGSHFYFIKSDKFLDVYSGQISNSSQITLTWINSLLSNMVTKKELIQTLDVVGGAFINNDIIVLTSSEMIEYDAKNDIFVSTGISFYQQGSLVTSLEQKIENYVTEKVNNNPIIKALQNIFVSYQSYSKLYAQVANTFITNKESLKAVLCPTTQSNQLQNSDNPVNTHKYFGYNENQVESGKASTTVFGSIDDYVSLINNSIKLTLTDTYTSNYLPTLENIPTVVFLQDTSVNGIMFGCKYKKDSTELSNLVNFGSIFKDNGSIDNNKVTDVHIKSDQYHGDTAKDEFSEILLNKYRLRYDKFVDFGYNLQVKKDFKLDGNFNNRWLRTAEYILTKYNETSDTRKNVIEVGLFSLNDLKTLNFKPETNKSFEPKYISDCIYRNISKFIELPNFSENEKRVVLTVEPTNDRLQNDYYIEDLQITESNDLKTLEWVRTLDTNISDDELKHLLVSSKHIDSLIKKINEIQNYIIENYWKRDEWEYTDRESSNQNPIENHIPKLNIHDLNVYSNTAFGLKNNNLYFESNINSILLTIGFNNPESKLFVRSRKQINVDFYQNLNDKENSNYSVVTANDTGNLIKKFGIFNKEKYAKNDNPNANLDLEYFIDIVENGKNESDVYKSLIPNVFQICLLSKSISLHIQKVEKEAWKKSDYTANADVLTGIDNSNDIEPGKIPNLYVTNLLGGKKLVIQDSDNYFKTGVTTLLNANRFEIDSKEIYIPQLTADKFVTLDDNKFLETINEKFNITEYPEENAFALFDKTINTPQNKILTADSFIWLNKRMNKIVGKISDDYYTKDDFAPEKFKSNPYFFDPDKLPISYLWLSTNFRIYGTFTMGPKNNSAINFDGSELTIGQSLNGQLRFRPDNIFFDYFKSDRDADENNISGKNSVLVTNGQGKLRNDIKLSNLPNGDTENLESEIPQNTTEIEKNKDLDSKKLDWKQVITGKQWNWLLTFIKNVKERFLNTFNTKETEELIYDNMPVGSIIIWTYASYLEFEKMLKNQGRILSDYIEDYIPKGWKICNGKNNTPDLTNCFVRGFDSMQISDKDNDLKVGEDSFKLIEKQLPELKHNNINCENTGKHTHSINLNTETTNNDDKKLNLVLSALDGIATHKTYRAAHKNNYSLARPDGLYVANNTTLTCIENDNHKHNITIDLHGKSENEQQEINIVPKYYKVVYIMKVDARKYKDK